MTDWRGTTTYTYDSLNCLTRVTEPDGKYIEYTYDLNGNRLTMRDHFAGSTIYTYTDVGDLSTLTDRVEYYQLDGLSSVKTITNSSAAMTDTYTTDAWGNTIVRNGATNHPYIYVGGLNYYTSDQGMELSLLQLDVRYYDASLGRFISHDPIGYKGGPNLYTYAANIPTIAVDPSGEICIIIPHMKLLHREQFHTYGIPDVDPGDTMEGYIGGINPNFNPNPDQLYLFHFL